MRYVNLSIVLVFRLVSTKVHSRFPDYESLVAARLLLPHEAERLHKAERLTPHESTWTPILWSLKLLERARTEGKLAIEAPVWANLVSSFEYLETANRKILNHGWVNFPVAYTQASIISMPGFILCTPFFFEGKSCTLFSDFLACYDKRHKMSRIFTRTERTLVSARSLSVIFSFALEGWPFWL